jgi:hypothetical protein
MDISKNDTAIVFIDPQNEVLSEKGLARGLVGGSVTENNTIENMERIFKAMFSRLRCRRTRRRPCRRAPETRDEGVTSRP